MYDGALKWLYPVSLRDDQGVIAAREDAAEVNIDTIGTVGERDVFVVAKGSSVTLRDWTIRPLLTEIENALNADLTNTYSIEARTVDGRFANTGLRITRTAGTKPFEFDLDDTDWTLPLRLLGWTSTYSSATSTSGNIDPPFSYFGAYHVEATPDQLYDLRADSDRMPFRSNIDPRFGWSNAWADTPTTDSVDAGRKQRRLRLRDLPAGRVLEARAPYLDTLAEDGGTRDPHAQLEHAWRAAPLGPSFLFPQFDEVANPLYLTWPFETAGIEAVQMNNAEQIDDFRMVVDDQKTPGERYKATVDFDSYDPRTVDH